MVGPNGNGFRVVLTADRTSMAGFPTLFDGMLAASQTTTVPRPVMDWFLAPSVPADGVRAVQAPLGLRRVEAALVEGGWAAEDVAVVPAEKLEKAVGPGTRVIGLASGDPLGRGMNSTTMTGVAGGEIYTARKFRELAEQIHEARAHAPHARTVMGGPGAWQLAEDEVARRRLGVDHVVSGACEANVAELFREIAEGEAAVVLEGRAAQACAVPSVRGATVMGSVEVSRGCGLGCRFCALARQPMQHLPEETILADVETNLRHGLHAAALVTEDIFRYGSAGVEVRPQALIGLLRRLRRLEGLRLLQTDHANVCSVAQYSDGDLSEVQRLMAGPEDPGGYVWLNLGVETANGQLLADNGGRAKMMDCPPAQWGEWCLEQVGRLAEAGFFPLVSLVLGLPGETPDHVRETLDWVSRLGDARVAVFPMFWAPLDGREPVTRQDMSRLHWRLFRKCYALNNKWIPRLLWDNQGSAGVPLLRRLGTQAMTRAGAVWWQSLLLWRALRPLRWLRIRPRTARC